MTYLSVDRLIREQTSQIHLLFIKVDLRKQAIAMHLRFDFVFSAVCLLEQTFNIYKKNASMRPHVT